MIQNTSKDHTIVVQIENHTTSENCTDGVVGLSGHYAVFYCGECSKFKSYKQHCVIDKLFGESRIFDIVVIILITQLFLRKVINSVHRNV